MVSSADLESGDTGTDYTCWGWGLRGFAQFPGKLWESNLQAAETFFHVVSSSLSFHPTLYSVRMTLCQYLDIPEVIPYRKYTNIVPILNGY
jgi:hypothetical protein